METLQQGLIAESSIVRRTVVLCAFVAPGLLLNFGLNLVASHLLELATFGVFYVSITMVAAFSAPVAVLTFFVSREIVLFLDTGPRAEAYAYALSLLKSSALVVAALFAGALVVLLTLGEFFDVSATIVVWMIAFNVLAASAVDISRGVVQGFRSIVGLGGFSFGWMALRFALGVGGIYWLGTAWGGLAGTAVAGLLAFGGFSVWLVRSAGPVSATTRPTAWLARVYGTWPLVIGYALTMLVGFADVLVAFIVLERAGVAVYAANSVLPKTLLAASFPVLQVMFPLAIATHIRNEVASRQLLRGVLATLAICIAGGATIYVLRGGLCGGGFGVQNCRGDALPYLLAGTLFACLFRVVTLNALARGRNAMVLLLVPVTVAAAGFAFFNVNSADELAINYLMLTVGVCAAALMLTMFGHAVSNEEMRD